MFTSKNKILLVLLILAAALLTPAATRLAYTGPNRRSGPNCFPGQTAVQIMTQKGNRDNNSCHIFVAFELACSDPGWKQYELWPYHLGTACEDGRDLWIDQATVIGPQASPPATVSGSLACSTPGNNGWCRAGSLAFSANEPLPGYQITDIEASGQGALCAINAASGSCNFSAPDGSASTNFWAVSTFGDTSAMGALNWQFDRVPPLLSVTDPPAADGLAGWYVHVSPSFSLSARDATSGLASAAFDNGSSSVTVIQDGTHSITASAADQAGNVASWSTTVKKDATPPSLSIPVTPDGLNGWYVTPPTLSLVASDATSGLARAVFSNGQATYPMTSQGVSTVTAQAVDIAGNTTSTAATVSVDTVSPVLNISSPAVDGLNGWYVNYPTFSLTASDATSGLVRAAFGNGQATTLIQTEGIYNLSASAVDRAGNTASAFKVVQVDTAPPNLSFSIPYPPDGLNGWYVTPPTLSLTASDTTSGLASAEFESGSSSFIPADGTQIVTALAKDNAGNIISISRSLKVDTTPPTLTPSISGIGAGGWYNSTVSISLNALDAVSGVGEAEYRLDSGRWQAGKELTVSADGEHTVEMRVTDNAGNVITATRSFKLDTTPPYSAFSNPPEGSEIKAAGTVELAGASSDALSGLAKTEISLDGGVTWLALPQTAGAWSYAWETLRVPDGLYTILVHADDQAGNRENTARVQVIVGNKPPKVEIQDFWWLWEAGYLKVQQRQIPVREVTVQISCAPYHPEVVLTFTGENFPSNLKWDRLCGNGTYAAESGNYSVTLTACDTFGHCAEDSGVIKVPFIGPPVPTWTPTALPSPTPRATKTLLPSPTMQPRVTTLPTVAATLEPVPTAPSSQPAWLAWSLAVLLAGLLALATAAVLDPRPRALRRLGKTLEGLARDGRA